MRAVNKRYIAYPSRYQNRLCNPKYVYNNYTSRLTSEWNAYMPTLYYEQRFEQHFVCNSPILIIQEYNI